MNIAFTLNGKKVMTQANKNLRLVDLLRFNFRLLDTKLACSMGICGACTVVFNGKVTRACLIPAFRVHESEILTIEGFSETENFKDILKGFEKTGLENCGYCNAGKILIAEDILTKNKQPDRKQILSGFSNIRCRCTESEALISAVLAAADLRQRRIYGRST
jgi:carbon-monoxide dehydrogenase small subunit